MDEVSSAQYAKKSKPFPITEIFQEGEPSVSVEDSDGSEWPVPEPDSSDAASASLSSESEDQASPGCGVDDTVSPVSFAAVAPAAADLVSAGGSAEASGAGPAADDPAFNFSSLAARASANKSMINFAPLPSASFAGL